MDKSEVEALIQELKAQHERVKANAAFLDLKRSEFRPDDGFSFCGLFQAKEELEMEQSLLAGHALMIQQMIAGEGAPISRPAKRLLNEISTSCRIDQP